MMGKVLPALPARLLRYVLVLLFLGQLAGCATALSSAAMAQVSPDIALPAVLDDPGRFKGRVILVAGHVLRVENRKDGTLLEILGYPTTDRGFPNTAEPALGRFGLRYPGYLDALVFRPGRQVAAVGKIVGRHTVTVGEAERSEPLLDVLELGLLPEEPTYYTPIHIGFGFMFGF